MRPRRTAVDTLRMDDVDTPRTDAADTPRTPGRPPRRPPWDRWSGIFILLWLVLVFGVPLTFVVGAMQAFVFMGATAPADADYAERAAWWTATWVIAFAVPVLGLGIAVWKRRKPSAIAFALALVLALGAGAYARAEDARERQQQEQRDQPPPPAGCFGDSPADEGNPACKGG